jgi:hypothetical protein
VAGTDYQSQTVFFGDGATLNATEAKRESHDYAAGDSVTVYYDPAHPARAVLERGIWQNSVSLALMGVLLFLFGILTIAASF